MGFKVWLVSFRIAQNIWLTSRGSALLAENVLTGQSLSLSSAEMDRLVDFCSPGDSLESDIDRKLHTGGLLVTEEQERLNFEERCGRLYKAIDKFLAEQAGCGPSRIRRQIPNSLDRLEKCGKDCLALLPPADKEAQRDIQSLFRNVKTFVTTPPVAPKFTQAFLNKIWARPLISDEYGQLPCLPETTERRIDLGLGIEVENPRCLVLGDDDLMSLCWSLKSDIPCDVFELDDRLLDFLREQNLPGLKVHKRDLTTGMPSEYHNRYHAIYTDPMYTRAGMDMFFLCCSQALSPDPGARIFLTTRPDLIEDGKLLEERLAHVDLEIAQHRVDFSRYRWPRAVAQRAFHQLQGKGLSTHLLTHLLAVPLYHADMLEVKRRG